MELKADRPVGRRRPNHTPVRTQRRYQAAQM